MASSQNGSSRTLSAARSRLAPRFPLRSDAEPYRTDNDALGVPPAAAVLPGTPAPPEDGLSRRAQPVVPPTPAFAQPATQSGGATAAVGQGPVAAGGPTAAPKRVATTNARGGHGIGAGMAARLAPAEEQPVVPARPVAPFDALPLASPPPFPPRRTPQTQQPTPPAATAAEPGTVPDAPVETTAQAPLGDPQRTPNQPGVPSADQLFDPAGQLSDRAVAALVDTARAQARNPQYDGTAGRRPVGDGLWLAWDDAADAPAAQPSGGLLLLAAEDSDARIGVARESATGAYLAWDLERNAPWPDGNGDPIALPADLIEVHAAAGGLSPLELATALVVRHELTALSEADQQSLPGRVAAINALLPEIRRGDHPLFDLYAPFVTTVEEMLPHAAGAAQWLRVTERRNARAITDQFLRLLDTGIEDPARLGEIIDPERARSAADPTRVPPSGTSGSPSIPRYSIEASDLDANAIGAADRILIADSGEIASDAADELHGVRPSTGAHSGRGPAAPGVAPEGSLVADGTTGRGQPLAPDGAERLVLDTGVALPPDAVADWVRQAASSEAMGSVPSRAYRPVGDTGLFVVWDEATGSPQHSDNDGHLVGTTIDGTEHFAVVRDTNLNLLRIWDLRNGTTHVDGDGRPAYLEPVSGISLVLPADYLPLLQGGVLNVLAFANASSRDEQVSAMLALQELRQAVEARGAFYRPIVDWFDMALAEVGSLHVDPLRLDGNGLATPETAASLERWAMSALSPRYIGSVLNARSRIEPALTEELFLGLQRTTGIRALDDNAGADVAFSAGSNQPFLHLPRETAVTFLTHADGAPVLEALSEWHAGRLTREEMADVLLRLAPTAMAAELTFEETVQALDELSAAINRGGEDLRAASTLFAVSLIDAGRVAGEPALLGEILLLAAEFAPVTGNILSAKAAAEDVEAFIDALERGAYDEAAFAGVLAILDGLGAIPIVGTLGIAAAKAVRRTLEMLPFADQRFVASLSRVPLRSNRLDDLFRSSYRQIVPPERLETLRGLIRNAVGKAAELAAQRRLTTITRRASPGEPTVVTDLDGYRWETTPDLISEGRVARFLNGLGLSLSDRVVYEIKTGRGTLRPGQLVMEASIKAGFQEERMYEALWLSLDDIPTEDLHYCIGEFLRKQFTEEETLALLRLLKRQMPDVRLIDLLDYMARGMAMSAHQMADPAAEPE